MFIDGASVSDTLAELPRRRHFSVGGELRLGVVIAYALRLAPLGVTRAAARLASMGYAIPGTVIAVGVLIPFARFDNWLDAWMREAFGVSEAQIASLECSPEFEALMAYSDRPIGIRIAACVST